jgi:hypothetical protein
MQSKVGPMVGRRGSGIGARHIPVEMSGRKGRCRRRCRPYVPHGHGGLRPRLAALRHDRHETNITLRRKHACWSASSFSIWSMNQRHAIITMPNARYMRTSTTTATPPAGCPRTRRDLREPGWRSERRKLRSTCNQPEPPWPCRLIEKRTLPPGHKLV